MPQAQFATGGNLLYLFYLIAPLIGGVIHLLIQRRHTGRAEVFLLWYLAIGAALPSFVAGYMQIVHPAQIASFVGWPNSPFLREVGMANTAWGVIIVVSLWLKTWRPAVITGFGLFLWMAAAQHIVGLVRSGNVHPGNAGPVLWWDILLPLVLVACLVLSKQKSSDAI